MLTVIRSGDGSFFEEGSDDETVTEADLDEDDQAEQASPMKVGFKLTKRRL